MPFSRARAHVLASYPYNIISFLKRYILSIKFGLVWWAKKQLSIQAKPQCHLPMHPKAALSISR